jgi:hypothetical protein
VFIRESKESLSCCKMETKRPNNRS